MTHRGVWYGVLAALVFGASLVVNKVGLLRQDLDPLAYTVLTTAVAGILSLPLVIRRFPAIRACSRRCHLNVLFLGVTASGISYILLFWGQSLTAATNAGFLLSLTAFFTILFAALLLGERIRRRQLPAIAVLAAGLYLLLVGAQALRVNTGDLILLATAALWGLTNAVSRFPMRELAGHLVASARLVIGAVFLLGVLLARDPGALAAAGRGEPWFLVSGLLMWATVVFLYKAIEEAGASIASIVVVTFPVVSTLGSVLFLHEGLSVERLLGGGLILFGVYWFLTRQSCSPSGV